MAETAEEFAIKLMAPLAAIAIVLFFIRKILDSENSGLGMDFNSPIRNSRFVGIGDIVRIRGVLLYLFYAGGYEPIWLENACFLS